MNKYLTEIKKLADGLMEKGIGFTFHALHDGYQVEVKDPKTQEYLWDAVCHNFSYGHNEGLLEIMGIIVENDYDAIEGWLTAEDILARV